MVQVNLSDYKNIYLQTAKEYLEKISLSLNQLSNNPLDKEALNNLHIASHSLKSQSQVMGFINIAKISEIIEKNSDDILSGANQINNEFLINLKDFINKLNLEFDQIEKGAA